MSSPPNSKDIVGIPDIWADVVGDLLDDTKSIALAVFDLDGNVLYANRGFRNFWTEADSERRDASIIVNPNFRSLSAFEESAAPVFEGLLTLSDMGAWSQSLNAVAYRRGKQLLILGEHDVAEMGRLNRAFYKVTQDINALQRELIKDKSGLERDLENSSRQEAALRRDKDVAELASRAKSEFLSSVSHELRTPLNAILGFGQMLRDFSDQPLTDEQAGYVAQIIDGGGHLLGLVNEILDLTKIESGEFDLSLEAVDLGLVMAESLGLVHPLAKENGIALAADASAAAGIVVSADRGKLRQVLLNLLSNAVKYNRSDGSVSVTAAATANGGARVNIVDTGPGIAADDRDDVFRPFSRLGKESSDIEGTGIGLAISRRLMESMGGRLDFDSIVGHGSTFWIEVPLAGRCGPA
ncbi:MAG: ATP-binding protein [Alphaproteobacteria bacterium]|jgi:signal transduction histidine kinase|nr:ATP-binding protein [Alphaproteobacteria bacterium]